MGARDIYNVLAHLPGIRLGQTNRGRTIVGVKGIRRETSDLIQFQLNRHILNEPSSGSATFLMEVANVPVEAIERIEVIRGPASAMYGANAFLAVVNIITNRVYGDYQSIKSEFVLPGATYPPSSQGGHGRCSTACVFGD